MDKCYVCLRLPTENNPMVYVCDRGVVCKDCDSSDRDAWADLKEARKKAREKRRNTLHNQIRKFKLENRVEFINDGTVVFDNKYYYYCQKKKARVKGNPKQYQMRGFAHFLEVFLKVK